jgi:hypothetical protein
VLIPTLPFVLCGDKCAVENHYIICASSPPSYVCRPPSFFSPLYTTQQRLGKLPARCPFFF